VSTVDLTCDPGTELAFDAEADGVTLVDSCNGCDTGDDGWGGIEGKCGKESGEGLDAFPVRDLEEADVGRICVIYVSSMFQ
jgi:hypothetical protein